MKEVIKCKHGNPKDTNCLACYNEAISPSDKTWEEIKEKYTQSGHFDLFWDITELDKDIEDLLTSATIKAKAELKEQILEDAKKAVGWVNKGSNGYSESFLSGYGKAYEQIINDLEEPSK